MKKLIVAALLGAAIPLVALAAKDIAGTGVVRKVDAAAGVVKLAHEPIPAVQWPAMTMDFRVKDAKLLSGIRPEQKVSFSFVKGVEGGYVITRIAPAK